MNYYKKELERIKRTIHANQWQIDSVISTRRYIQTHYDQDLNLEILSQQRYMSKYHLLRLFKRYYGLTPRQYLIDMRLEKSKEFLKSGMTASATCFAIGFGSPSSFSALFKNKIGVTPMEYQKEQLSIRN